jgi:regulatory protein
MKETGVHSALFLESVTRGSKPDVFKVKLSGGGEFLVSLVYMPLESRGLFLSQNAGGPASGSGIPLDEKLEALLIHARDSLAAEEAALRLVARAEQCSAGLLLKLRWKKYSPAAAEAAVSRLAGQNLVNDRRYAELWLKLKIRGGTKSPRHLISALRCKGIDKDTAGEVLEEQLTLEAEEELLHRFAARNCRDKIPPRGFFRSEGFSAAAVDAYIEARAENGEESR